MNEYEIKQKILQLTNLINTHKKEGNNANSTNLNKIQHKQPAASQYPPKSPTKITSIIPIQAKPSHSSVTYVNNIPVPKPQIPIASYKKLVTPVSSPPIVSHKIPKAKFIYQPKPSVFIKGRVNGYQTINPFFVNTPRLTSSSIAFKKRLLLSKSIYNKKPIYPINNNVSTTSSINPIFIKKGNSLVRKSLEDKYILPTNNKPSPLIASVITSPMASSSIASVIRSPMASIKKQIYLPITQPKIKKTILPTNGNKKVSFLDKIRDKLGNKPTTGKGKNIKKKKVEYCLFFNKFGKCNNGDKCRYSHDKEKVRTCPRFLSDGGCDDENCTLKHKATDVEQMPVCLHYLKGRCILENCPYLHVNVSSNAEVCKDFQKGNCPLGSKCKLKHIYGKVDNSGGKDNNNNRINKNDVFFEGIDQNLFNY